MQPDVRYCTTADGMRIAYTVTGRGTPFVSLIDPLVSHVSLEWSNPVNGPVLELEAQQLKLVRMDVRGSGLSTRVPIRSVDDVIRDVEAVVGQLGLTRFVLNANTTLTAHAIAYAAAHADMVSRLVLVDAVARWSDLFSAPQLGALAAAAATDWETATEILGTIVFGPGRQESLTHGEYVRRCMNQDDYLAGQEHLIELDVTREAASLAMPVMLVRHLGVRWISDEVTQDLAARIPDARLVTVDGTWVDDTEGLIARIIDFVYEDGEAPAARQAAVAESGVRTVLFTDIVGHTGMMQRLGDERGRAVLREHERITREVLKEHGGAEVKTMGDGFMASFGSVTRGMDCAIALQRAFAAHEGEPLRVRVGINAGEPIEEDGDLFGAAVILASRIAAKAGAGEILVPDTVRGLVSGKGYVFGDRGEFVPKGFDEGVRLWEVRWR